MMPTEDAAYYTGRNRASIAMSIAAKEIGIRKIHLDLARRYASLADASSSQMGSSHRQAALDVADASGGVVVPSETVGPTFPTPSATGLASDRILASAREAATQAHKSSNGP